MQEKELKISEIKGRFLQFLDKQNISVYKFSTESGISKSNFSGKSLESELGGEQISKILTYFPNLNPEWLLLGIGEMLRSEPPKPAPEASRSDEIWKEILAEKDRRIEELIIENYKIREQVAHIQAITPPPFRNGLIKTELHTCNSDASEETSPLTPDYLAQRSHQYLVSLALRQQETIFLLSETFNFNKQND